MEPPHPHLSIRRTPLEAKGSGGSAGYVPVDPPDAPSTPQVRRIDRLIAGMARRQRGVVARGQLLAAGVSRNAIDHRVATGRLHVLWRGVYLVGHEVAPVLARETAVLLLHGEDAVLSHLSAAAFWCITAWPAEVHVTVPAGGSRARAGIAVHRSAVLPSRHVLHREGLRVTSPPWTLLDLSEVLPRDDLARALNEAHVRRLVRLPELERMTRAVPGRRGTAALLDLLGARPARTRSDYERRMLALIAEAGLPAPETNVSFGRWTVDGYYRDKRLAYEIDPFGTHGSPWAFERDRRKDGDLLGLGVRSLRVSGRELDERPAAVVRRLVRALDAA